MHHPLAPELALLHRLVLRWYAASARPLPWRAAGTSPWGVFLSEVMSQQTPVARVEPVWREWVHRWPSPGGLAGATPGEAVRAWGRLGYPRRALRVHEAATEMVRAHEGAVPATVEELLALPGVGRYTAAAVASFGFGVPAVVVDTNVRRVLARVLGAAARAAPVLTRAETQLAAGAMPADPGDANTWSVAVMELGALVCTARSPRCGDCPIAHVCAWNRAGWPAYEGPLRSAQAWEGTDRQARGALLAVLRAADGAVSLAALAGGWPDEPQRSRCLDSLVADGLVEPLAHQRFRLPS